MGFSAVTSAPPGNMMVPHGASVASHAGSIGWCACEPEHVVVAAPATASPTQGVRLYAANARALGGPQGWALVPVRPDSVAGGGEGCPEGALLGWIAPPRLPRRPRG